MVAEIAVERVKCERSEPHTNICAFRKEGFARLKGMEKCERSEPQLLSSKYLCLPQGGLCPTERNGMESNMNNIRIRFSKTGALRFIGHLDFLRVFQQTIRRAGLPVAYSQGFNPHILISFALPLPLGMDSVNDYADLTLTTEIPPEEITQRLNVHAPPGLYISRVTPIEKGRAAAITAAADYALKAVVSDETIAKVLAPETLIIAKKSKSGVKDTDIRPDIISISNNENEVIMRLSAGSARFLNPLIVAELLMGEKTAASNLSRLELYQSDSEGGFSSL